MCSEKVDSIESFLNRLPRISEKMTGKYYYCGHSDLQYTLLPSVLRGSAQYCESEIFNLTITECSKEFNGIISHADILSKMQHFGIPTRMLDITSNPLVALYFACEGNRAKDGSVHVLKCEGEIQKYDSDKVSLLACLPRFNQYEQEEMRNLVGSATGGENDRNRFNNTEIIKRLLHEVRKEKPAFAPAIVPEDLLRYYFYAPKKTTDRIIRQNGAFIIFGLDSTPPQSDQIIIDAGYKQRILDQLSCFGISKATLFPELYKVAEYIKEKYML